MSRPVGRPVKRYLIKLVTGIWFVVCHVYKNVVLFIKKILEFLLEALNTGAKCANNIGLEVFFGLCLWTQKLI